MYLFGDFDCIVVLFECVVCVGYWMLVIMVDIFVFVNCENNVWIGFIMLLCFGLCLFWDGIMWLCWFVGIFVWMLFVYGMLYFENLFVICGVLILLLIVLWDFFVCDYFDWGYLKWIW